MAEIAESAQHHTAAGLQVAETAAQPRLPGSSQSTLSRLRLGVDHYVGVCVGRRRRNRWLNDGRADVIALTLVDVGAIVG